MAKLTDSLEACFPHYAQESTLGPRFPVFAVVNDSPNANDAANVQRGYGPLELGQPIVDRYGFHYIYVRSQATLALGQVVTLATNPLDAGAGEIAVLAAAQGADNIHIVRTEAAGLVKNAEAGNFIHFGNNTGTIGDLKLILGNTATGIAADGTADAGNAHITISRQQIFFGLGGYDANAPAAAYAAATSEVSIIRPYHVAVAGLSAAAMGVSMGVVTAGNNTMVQVVGLANVKGVAGTSFTDNVNTYTAAAGEISVTAPAAGLAGTSTLGLSKSSYGGAASVTVPVWLMNIMSRW